MGYEPSSLSDCPYNASKIELGVYHTLHVPCTYRARTFTIPIPIPSLYFLPHPLCSTYILISYENVVQWLKDLIRSELDFRRLIAICGGDTVMGRRVTVKCLRVIADDMEDEKD